MANGWNEGKQEGCFALFLSPPLSSPCTSVVQIHVLSAWERHCPCEVRLERGPCYSEGTGSQEGLTSHSTVVTQPISPGFCSLPSQAPWPLWV